MIIRFEPAKEGTDGIDSPLYGQCLYGLAIVGVFDGSTA